MIKTLPHLIILILIQSLVSLGFAQVGVYQGTFDPPHLGHEEVAKNAVKAGDLRIIYVLAMPDNPDKPNATPYPARQRMVESQFGEMVEFRTADEGILEAFKNGFVQGMFRYLQERHPNETVYHVLGSDAAAKYPDNQRIHHRENRGTLMSPRDASDIIPEDLRRSELFIELPEPKIGVSSTEIRKAINEGQSHWAVEPKVLQLINEYGLYRPKSCRQLF